MQVWAWRLGIEEGVDPSEWRCDQAQGNNGMLEKLHMQTQILTKLLGSHYYVLRAHVIEKCYVLFNLVSFI